MICYCYLLILSVITSNVNAFPSKEITTKEVFCKQKDGTFVPCSSEPVSISTSPVIGFVVALMPFTVNGTAQSKNTFIKKGSNEIGTANIIDRLIKRKKKPKKIQATPKIQQENITQQYSPITKNNVTKMYTKMYEEKVKQKSTKLHVTQTTVSYEHTTLSTINSTSVLNQTTEIANISTSPSIPECNKTCPDSCQRVYKNGQLILLTSPCGITYEKSFQFCTENEGEIFIPRDSGDNDLIFNFGADFYSKDKDFEYFWYPMQRPDYGKEPVWADGKPFSTYETPFYGDSNNNKFRCFVFRKEGDDLTTYDQFCRVLNARPICKLWNNQTTSNI